MDNLTVRTNLLESSKFLLSIRKFLLPLFQENDFLFQAEICPGRFLVSKKWPIWRTSKILLKRSNLLLVLGIFFLKIRIALFAVPLVLFFQKKMDHYFYRINFFKTWLRFFQKKLHRIAIFIFCYLGLQYLPN